MEDRGEIDPEHHRQYAMDRSRIGTERRTTRTVHTLRRIDDRRQAIEDLERLLPLAGARRDAIVREMGNIRKGVKGEREAAYHIEHEFKDSQITYAVHGLRIEHDGEVAQIDHLLFNRYTRRMVLIETKHLNAELTINQHGEWTATYGNGSFGIPSPTRQAKRHETILRRRLRDTGHDEIRDFATVALVGTRTVVERRSTVDPIQVVRADMFGLWYQSIVQAAGYLFTGARLLDRMSHENAMAFMKALSDSHVPERFDWAKRFGVSAALPRNERPSRLIEPITTQSMLDLKGGDAEKDEFPALTSNASIVPIADGSIKIFRNGRSHRTVTCADRRTATRIDRACAEMGVEGSWHEPTSSWRMTYRECVDLVTRLGGDASGRNAKAATGIVPSVTLELTHPDRVETPLGDVEFRRLPMGNWATRTARDHRLIDHVDQICIPFGEWYERYENWLIDDADMPRLRDEIGRLTNRLKKTAMQRA